MAGKETAETVVMALGGVGRLRAMVGVRHILYSEESECVSFQFKGSRKFNAVRITYNAGTDLFDVEFIKYGRNFVVRKTEETDGVYVDMLKSLFESTTGLYLSL